MNIIAIFATDDHHSYDSQRLLGVAKDKEAARIALGAELNEAGHHPLSGDDCANLMNLGQTQGYEGDGEFVFRELWLNDIDLYVQ